MCVITVTDTHTKQLSKISNNVHILCSPCAFEPFLTLPLLSSRFQTTSEGDIRQPTTIYMQLVKERVVVLTKQRYSPKKSKVNTLSILPILHNTEDCHPKTPVNADVSKMDECSKIAHF